MFEKVAHKNYVKFGASKPPYSEERSPIRTFRVHTYLCTYLHSSQSLPPSGELGNNYFAVQTFCTYSALNAHVHAHDNLRKIFRENARAKMHFCHVRLLRKREFKAKTLLTLNESLADLPQNNFLWAMHRFEIIKIPFLTFPAYF